LRDGLIYARPRDLPGQTAKGSNSGAPITALTSMVLGATTRALWRRGADVEPGQLKRTQGASKAQRQ
jgi:hypothetical protein